MSSGGLIWQALSNAWFLIPIMLYNEQSAPSREHLKYEATLFVDPIPISLETPAASWKPCWWDFVRLWMWDIEVGVKRRCPWWGRILNPMASRPSHVCCAGSWALFCWGSGGERRKGMNEPPLVSAYFVLCITVKFKVDKNQHVDVCIHY